MSEKKSPLEILQEKREKAQAEVDRYHRLYFNSIGEDADYYLELIEENQRKVGAIKRDIEKLEGKNKGSDGKGR